jgi:hypothetical protein
MKMEAFKMALETVVMSMQANNPLKELAKKTIEETLGISFADFLTVRIFKFIGLECGPEFPAKRMYELILSLNDQELSYFDTAAGVRVTTRVRDRFKEVAKEHKINGKIIKANKFFLANVLELLHQVYFPGQEPTRETILALISEPEKFLEKNEAKGVRF